MSIGARIRCVIVGCRRTFKPNPRHRELMCARHYGADPALKVWHQQTKRWARRTARWAQQAQNLADAGYTRYSAPDYLRYLWRRALYADTQTMIAWRAVKSHAQALQDAGFFAPKHRGRHVTNSGGKTDMPKIGHSFEQEFQRVKRQMDVQRRVR